MKKSKIISSLAMAGCLSMALAGGTLAVDTDSEKKALGEYSKIIEGKVVIPCRLFSYEDRITGEDIKNSFPGKEIIVEDSAVLKTGDVISINGEERTIVIYGDINCDGKVNILDAVTTLNYVKNKNELSKESFVAADLKNKGEINILEAVNLLNVVKGKASFENLSAKPESEDSIKNEEVTKVDIIEIKDAYAISNALTKVEINDNLLINGKNKIGYYGNKIYLTDNDGKIFELGSSACNFSKLLEVIKVMAVGDTISTNKGDNHMSVTVTVETKVNNDYKEALAQENDLLIVNATDAIIKGKIYKAEVNENADLMNAIIVKKVIAKSGVVLKAHLATLIDITGTVVVNNIIYKVEDGKTLSIFPENINDLFIQGSENDVEIRLDESKYIYIANGQKGKLSITQTSEDNEVIVIGKIFGQFTANGSFNLTRVIALDKAIQTTSKAKLIVNEKNNGMKVKTSKGVYSIKIQDEAEISLTADDVKILNGKAEIEIN